MSTVATTYGIDTPNPRAVDDQREAGVPGSAVLQPDHRTIVVGYEYGGCDELAQATALLRGSHVTVSVIVGRESSSNETLCPLVLSRGETLVRLPDRIPADIAVTVARRASRR